MISQHRSVFAGVGLMAALLAAPPQLAAQPLRERAVEKIEFETVTYASFADFRLATGGRPDRAHVYLWLPERDGRVPAVMIGHSIGGWQDGSEGQYVAPLLAAGFAVLGLDHFSGRGIQRAADVPGAISPASPPGDALRALRRVAGHPRLDAARIGIMGLSMGGITAEHTAFEHVRRKALGDSPLKFAAHVSFYAPCGQYFSNGADRVLTGAPVLRMQAARDETAPPEKCGLMAALAKAASPQVPFDTILFAGAYHAWDVAFFSPPKFFPHHVNNGKCPLVDYGAQFRILDSEKSQRMPRPNELTDCLRASAGYTMGFDAEVAATARTEMLAFFTRHLKSGG